MMKWFQKTICFMLGLLLISMNTLAYADSGTDTYTDTINHALSSDGFEVGSYADLLVVQFQKDPSGFLDILGEYNATEIDDILGLIAGHAALDASEEFEAVLYSLDISDSVCSKLITYYEEAKELNMTMPNTGDYHVPVYDMDTIDSLVSAYFENGNTENMELFTLLANAYQQETELLEPILNHFSNEEIVVLATGISTVYKQEGIELPQVFSENGNYSPFQKALSEAYSLESSDISESAMPLAAINKPEITSFSYSGTITVGKATPLSIKLTETNGTSSIRTYTVKVYCTRDGEEYQVASTTMTIPQNSTTVTKTIKLTFSNAGSFTTRVAVYNGSTLLVTREGRNPDISHGKWRITCTFPVDRRQYGTFALYNAAGELQVSGSCIGRSTKNIDENLSYGNTPTGTYTGYLYGPMTGKDTDGVDKKVKYGPNKVIKTSAVDVPCINNGTRTNAMWIHGGRSQSTLQPTDGCVRVFDKDMLSIQRSIESMTTNANGHDKTGNLLYQQR